MSGFLGDLVSGISDLFGGSSSSTADPSLLDSSGNYIVPPNTDGTIPTATGSVTDTTGSSGSGLGSIASGLSGLVTPQSAATLGGALISSNANSNAAQTVAGANSNAAQIAANANIQAANIQAASQAAARAQFAQSAQTGVGDIQQGVANFQNTINPILTQSAIQLPAYRDLTAQQQIGESDLLRNNQATLAASGLRGAGRAGIAAAMNSDANYQAGVRATNDATNLASQQQEQATQNQARTGLAQIQAQAGGAEAATEVGAGNNIGNSLQQQGNSTAGLASSTGSTGAQLAANTGSAAASAGLANGNVDSSALGALSSIYASPNANGSSSTDLLNNSAAASVA